MTVQLTVLGPTFSMRRQLYLGHYLSHYVMEGEGEGNVLVQLCA